MHVHISSLFPWPPPRFYLVKSGRLLDKFWEWPGKGGYILSTRKLSKSGTGSNIYKDISQYFTIAELVKVIEPKILEFSLLK